ncbi:MAG TPA: gamma-glutamyl-gamma-aminobutyrate hydrolase family protein [Rhizomicrobium sp.]
MRKPLVGIICDRRRAGDHFIHKANEDYIEALRGGADAVPLLIPVPEPPLATRDLLQSLDGFVFTGSVSDVSPARYGGEPPRAGSVLDAHRDASALALITAAAEAGKPILAICRGFQELNVAFGGTLHQQLHLLPGKLDHREDAAASLDVQYGPAHEVAVTADGLLSRLTQQRGFTVNSLHWQGIDRLAPGLVAEAVAPDGQIEAVSRPGSFLLGLQWHPEWRWAEDPVSRAILTGFGASLRRQTV